jgi:hypothetical protein
MHPRLNFARISLAVLWIMTGLFFGGLGFLATPTQQAAHKAHSPAPWTHAGVSSAAPRV